jgi:hypothetical protein
MRIRSRSLVSFLALGLVAMATEASAQDGPPPEFEKIKALEPFVGFWEHASPQENGEPVMASSRFISNRRYLQMQVSSQSEEGRQIFGTMLIGWDHAKEQVTYWGFWPDQQLIGSVEVGNGTAKWHQTAALPGGEKSSANVVMKVSGDEFTIDVTDSKRGDEQQPDMHFTFKRSERRGRGR